MLPREGTETRIYSSFVFFMSVNNPCYLERGRKPCKQTIFGFIVSKLITHVTSRGDFLGEIHKTT